MERVGTDSDGFFTYTIGITCMSPEHSEVETLAAVDAIGEVPTGRWPISFFPPVANFFSQEARVFYRASVQPKPWEILRKIFGK